MADHRSEQREPILSPEQNPVSGLTLDWLIDHLEVRGYEVSLLSGQRRAAAKWTACVRASRRGRCIQIAHAEANTALEALERAYAKALEPEPECKPSPSLRLQPSLTLEDLDL